MLTKDTQKNLERVKALWSQLEAIYEKTSPSYLTADWPRFSNYAWDNFDPKTVIDILLSNKQTYEPLRDVLFSGLCSWTVAPNDEDLTKNAMMLVGIKYLCHLELLGRGAFPDQPIFGDAASRISPTGRDFFRDFYHPIGGLITLLESSSQDEFSERLFSASELTMNVVGLMTTVHMHVAHVAPLGRFANASTERGLLTSDRSTSNRSTLNY